MSKMSNFSVKMSIYAGALLKLQEKMLFRQFFSVANLEKAIALTLPKSETLDFFLFCPLFNGTFDPFLATFFGGLCQNAFYCQKYKAKKEEMK